MSTDTQQLEQDKAIDHIRELLQAHYHEAEDSADDNGKFSIGFRVTFDRGASLTKLKVVSRIAKTITDEIESEVADPRQPALF